VSRPTTGTPHHIEIWVPDLDRAILSWGWLLEHLGYTAFQSWSAGRSWRLGPTYIVVEQSSDLVTADHDRRRPGLNHLAFHVEGRQLVDTLTVHATRYGWTLLFPDRHPYAGGPDHYAAYLENADGFEVELVAIEDVPTA
jgi:catechol 2,3-dioxygenase-like lactoylglutathione lyase family enzyme